MYILWWYGKIANWQILYILATEQRPGTLLFDECASPYLGILDSKSDYVITS